MHASVPTRHGIDRSGVIVVAKQRIRNKRIIKEKRNGKSAYQKRMGHGDDTKMPLRPSRLVQCIEMASPKNWCNNLEREKKVRITQNSERKNKLIMYYITHCVVDILSTYILSIYVDG
jgi:hypothetical protein